MPLFIALRYMLAHLRQTFICIAGVAISVTMFIGMTSMMQGFSDKFIIETVESSGHITIHDEPRQTRTPILERVVEDVDAVLDLRGDKPREQIRKIKNPTGILDLVRLIPEVTAAAPVVQGEAIATFGTKTQNLVIQGVEPDSLTNVTTIGTKLTSGSFARLRTTSGGIIIGRGISEVLGARLDDTIVVTSSNGGQLIAKVVGVFDTGVTPVDYSRAYLYINTAQTLLDRKNVVNEIILRTDDYQRADDIAQQIEGIVGYRTESWKEANMNFLQIFTIQQIITWIITGALIVVAAFGVLNILIMAVLERINDIAILRSFGLSRADITKIYLLQGLILGVIGSLLGVAAGKLTVEGLRRLPIRMEGLVRADGLLMSESTAIYVSSVLLTLVVVLFAAVYPARRAAGYDPVEIIRGAH